MVLPVPTSSLPPAFDLNDVEEYLRDTLKSTNVGKAMRVIRPLVRGEGVSSQHSEIVFMAGVPVTPRDDLDMVWWNAKNWLPRHIDRGNGYYRHGIQKLINYRNDRLIPRHARFPSSVLSDIAAMYDSEEEERQSPPSVSSPQQPSPRQPSPRQPSPKTQMMRTLGLCEELKEFLRRGGETKKGKRTDYTLLSNKLLLSKVKEWLRDTDKGRAHLSECDVDQESFSVDHVWAESAGGPNVLDNYHIMPTGTNSHFMDMPWTNREKMEYVGPAQVRLVREMAHRARDSLPWSEVSVCYRH